MKEVIYLVILMTAVSLIQGDEKDNNKYTTCVKTCNETPKHQWHYVCNKLGQEFQTQCHFDCLKNFDLKKKPAEEAECKEGGFGHCWNNKCTEEDRKILDEPTMCQKEPPHESTRSPCKVKCLNENRKKDVEFVPCSEVKK